MTRLEQAITIRARNELDPCFDSVARNQFLKMKAKLFSFHDINDGLDEREKHLGFALGKVSPRPSYVTYVVRIVGIKDLKN